MDETKSHPPVATRNPTWVEEASLRAGRSLAAGGTYFLALVGVGWGLGPIREFVVARGFNLLTASLIEAAPMLVVMAFVSAWAMRRFQVCDSAGDRLMVGAVAVTLVVSSEFIGGALVRGWGPYETLANLTTRPGSALVVLLVIALLTPLIEPMGRAKLRSP